MKRMNQNTTKFNKLLLHVLVYDFDLHFAASSSSSSSSWRPRQLYASLARAVLDRAQDGELFRARMPHARRVFELHYRSHEFSVPWAIECERDIAEAFDQRQRRAEFFRCVMLLNKNNNKNTWPLFDTLPLDVLREIYTYL